MEEVCRYQIAAVVVRVHEAVGYVDQYSEAGGKDHQLARNLLAAELWWFAPRHAAGTGQFIKVRRVHLNLKGYVI